MVEINEKRAIPNFEDAGGINATDWKYLPIPGKKEWSTVLLKIPTST
jgi:hypothetical protein